MFLVFLFDCANRLLVGSNNLSCYWKSQVLLRPVSNYLKFVFYSWVENVLRLCRSTIANRSTIFIRKKLSRNANRILSSYFLKMPNSSNNLKMSILSHRMMYDKLPMLYKMIQGTFNQINFYLLAYKQFRRKLNENEKLHE